MNTPEHSRFRVIKGGKEDASAEEWRQRLLHVKAAKQSLLDAAVEQDPSTIPPDSAVLFVTLEADEIECRIKTRNRMDGGLVELLAKRMVLDVIFFDLEAGRYVSLKNFLYLRAVDQISVSDQEGLSGTLKTMRAFNTLSLITPSYGPPVVRPSPVWANSANTTNESE